MKIFNRERAQGTQKFQTLEDFEPRNTRKPRKVPTIGIYNASGVTNAVMNLESEV